MRALSSRVAGNLITSPLRVALAVVFAVLAALATFGHQWLLAFDGPASGAIRGESLAGPFQLITIIGGIEVAIAGAVAIVGATWRKCRGFALAYPVMLVIGAVVNVGLKEIIGRPRPPSPITGVALASFPSGHTMQATLLLGLLPAAAFLLTRSRRVQRAVAAMSIVGIVAVGASRIYLGAHWPTDVVGGILVGVGLIALTEHWLRQSAAHRGCRCSPVTQDLWPRAA